MKKTRSHNFIDKTGEVHDTRNSGKIEIIAYNNAKDIKIKFLDDYTILSGVAYSNIISGLIKKPINRVGEKYLTNQGYWVEIIEYLGERKCTVKFLHNNFIISGLQHGNIKTGEVSNPFHPSLYGIGYLGIGKYKKTENGIKTKCYEKWVGIFTRSYSNNFKVKNVTYKDAEVLEHWHNFQNFGKWYEDNYKDHMIGWQLDKDILVKGNKVYSPETCCFVPQEINNLFVKSNATRGKYPIGVCYNKRNKKFIAIVNKSGTACNLGYFDTIEEAFQAYKVAKETWIKEVADIWKPLIKENVYQALMNYKVEITD